MTSLRDSSPDVFWGEIAPCEHLVQIYDEDPAFLDSLTAFVESGLKEGEAVVLIATPPHLLALEDRLEGHGLDIDRARLTDQYITLDAEQTLARFLMRGWPDEEKFRSVIRSVLVRARSGGRRVRAFGEMVALLWARGHTGATVQLEHLWHRLCQEEAFALFCAYPRAGFTKDAQKSFDEICAAHTRVVKPRCTVA